MLIAYDWQAALEAHARYPMGVAYIHLHDGAAPTLNERLVRAAMKPEPEPPQKLTPTEAQARERERKRLEHERFSAEARAAGMKVKAYIRMVREQRRQAREAAV